VIDMADDWAADVLKYVPDADGDIITGIVRYCGIALRSKDASLVSFSDKTETDRVKANFLKKKLGLTDADSVLDAAIAAVGDRMKADRTKNRVTVYYLLASHFGRLEDFRPKAAKAAKPAKTAPAAELPLAAAAIPEAPPVAAAAPVMAPPPPAPPVEPPPPVKPVMAAAMTAVSPTPARRAAPARKKGSGLFFPLTALLLATGGVAAVILLGSDKSPAPAIAAPALPVPVTASLPAPAEPAGAGLVTEDREGQPVLIVYFDVGKAAIAEGFAEKASAVKAWASSHPGSKYVISGYNDPTGNAAANAELSKNRAQAVQAALVATGVAEADTVLEKPPETTDAAVTPAQARRVEVIVR
jgi:outer membrane protein OmpA-like peptidoglycan-associated protein